MTDKRIQCPYCFTGTMKRIRIGYAIYKHICPACKNFFIIDDLGETTTEDELLDQPPKYSIGQAVWTDNDFGHAITCKVIEVYRALDDAEWLYTLEGDMWITSNTPESDVRLTKERALE